MAGPAQHAVEAARAPAVEGARVLLIESPYYGAIAEALAAGAIAELEAAGASFERVAVVTDARWAAPALKMFSVTWPGKARAFPLAELDAAKTWAAADDAT